MSNFPSVRPSLNLQFDSQPTPADMTSHLASVGATFSRASIGTYTDANGLVAEATAGQARPNYSTAGVHEGLLIEEARTNLIEASEDLTDSNWGKEADVSVLENQAIAPNGKASADKLVYSSTNEFHRLSYALSVTSGTTYSFSAYVKADGYNFVLIRWQGFVSGGQDNVSFDLVDVETDVVDSNFDSASIEAVGNDWYKITVVGTAYDNSSSIFRIRFQPTAQTDGSIDRFTGDGESGGFVWGAQFEAGSFPTSYIPTIPTFTSRASDGTYFDSSGVLQTASTNVARTDHKYIDGEWVEAGLLLEGASTNLLKRSQDLSTTWDTVNTTVTTNQVNGLDGTLTADLLKEDSLSSTHYLSQSGTFSSGTTYTFSTFAKNASGTRYLQLRVFGIGANHAFVNFDLVNGEIPTNGSGGDDFISATIEDVGNGWYRCSMTGNYSATPTGFLFGISNSATAELPNYTGDNTSGFYIWGTQAEAQNQATSYIKTVDSTATRSADVYTTATKARSADVCYIDGTAFTDFYNQEEGTFFVFWEGFTDGGVDRWIGVHDSSKANVFDDRIIFAFSTSAESIRITISDDGVVQTSSVNDTDVAQTTPNKYALAVKLNDVNSYQDGVQVVSDTSVTMPSADKLVFHNGAGVRPFQGYIRKLIYFPRRLSDNELIKLTQ